PSPLKSPNPAITKSSEKLPRKTCRPGWSFTSCQIPNPPVLVLRQIRSGLAEPSTSATPEICQVGSTDAIKVVEKLTGATHFQRYRSPEDFWRHRISESAIKIGYRNHIPIG